MTAEQIMTEIRNFFGDTQRSQAETKEGLEEIAELAVELANTLEEDDQGDL